MPSRPVRIRRFHPVDFPQQRNPARKGRRRRLLLSARIPAHHRAEPHRTLRYPPHTGILAHRRQGDGSDRPARRSRRHGLDHDRGKRRLVGRSPQPVRCRRHPPRDPRGGFHAPAARPALPVQGIDRNFRPLSAFSVSLRRSEQEKSVPMKPDSAASGINRIVRGPTFRLRNEDERAGNLRRRRQFRIHVPSLLFSTVFAIIHAYIFH